MIERNHTLNRRFCMGDTLKIDVACGGTGGHIFPGLATAYELLGRGHDVTLWLAGKDIEHDAVGNWPGKIETIPAEGFQFGLSLRSFKTAFRLYKAYRLAYSRMRNQAPQVLLAMGSYASFGPVKAARKLRIPYVLHEANLIPGRAVSLLAGKADTVAVSFEKTSYYLKHPNIVLTGFPLRLELQEGASQPRKERGQGEPLRIMVMGGSRGAQALNDVVPNALGMAFKKGIPLEVVHIAGLQDTDKIKHIYAKAGVKAVVHQFIKEMAEIYRNTDLAISRSGAATCAELAVFGIPALLVPYPHAVRDHQMSNARILQDAGAADVVAQEDLTATWLRDYIINVAERPKRLERMVEAMKKRSQVNATEKLADLLERIAGA